MLYCGIDVAKHRHVVALLDEQGQKLQPVFGVGNDREGLDHLAEVLAMLRAPLTVGLEATGHYWLSLYEVLSGQGYPMVVLNPMQVAAYRKSGIRKIKSDNTDAVWIADFLRIAHLPATNREMPVLLQLRELSRFRYWLSEQIGDCKRKLLTILDRVFPEYEGLFSSVFVQSSRALLREAISAQEFASFDLQELSQLLAHSSRGHFGTEKAQELQAQARQSIGVGFLVDAARMELRCLLAQMDLLEQQRMQVEQNLEKLMQQIPQHLTSIPGLGLVTGAAILAEIGDIARFSCPEKLVAYAGIDATVYQTGQFEAAHAHMSKRGSAYLRVALWQAAGVAIQYDSELKAFYQRKRAEGKHYNVAIGAVCRKLLDRIYVILKEQRPYVIR